MAAARMLSTRRRRGRPWACSRRARRPPTIELPAEARTEPPPLPDGAAELPAAAQAGPLFRQDGVIYRVEDQATLQRGSSSGSSRPVRSPRARRTRR